MFARASAQTSIINLNKRPIPGQGRVLTAVPPCFPARAYRRAAGALSENSADNGLLVFSRPNNGWRDRRTYWLTSKRSCLRSVCSSGRIFRSSGCPGSHLSRVRCQQVESVLVSIIAFFVRQLCHKYGKKSIFTFFINSGSARQNFSLPARGPNITVDLSMQELLEGCDHVLIQLHLQGLGFFL